MSSNTTAKNPNQAIKLFASILFLVISAFGIGALFGAGLTRANFESYTPLGSLPYDESYINDIYTKLEQEYLGDLPDSQRATHGIAKGLLESLDDEYSAFLTPDEAKEYMAGNDSEYEGIGVQLGFDGQYTSVVSPMKGFPGYEAGLRTGDLILEVDGEDQTGVRPEIVAPKIRGEAGTVVTLTIYRETKNKADVFEVEITRAKVDLENITYEDLGGGIYMIDIIKFTEGPEGFASGVDVFNRSWDKIVTQISANKPKGIIIDLRNNPGGYVDSVQYVAEEFLKDGVLIMKEQEKGKEPVEYRDDRKGRLEDTPVVVLVNAGSASASEIFAAAIQDNDRGEVIGEETVGKGVEQRLLPMDDEALILLVFRKWLTPNGVQITKDNPIKPDQVVEYEVGKNGKNDSQIQKAIELLK